MDGLDVSSVHQAYQQRVELDLCSGFAVLPGSLQTPGPASWRAGDAQTGQGKPGGLLLPCLENSRERDGGGASCQRTHDAPYRAGAVIGGGGGGEMSQRENCLGNTGSSNCILLDISFSNASLCLDFFLLDRLFRKYNPIGGILKPR